MQHLNNTSPGELSGNEQSYNGQSNLPDTILNIPQLKVDEIDLKADNLDVKVALKANLTNMINIGIGAHVQTGKIKVEIQGVSAEAYAHIRLRKVKNILTRTIATLDKNPELLKAVLDPGSDDQRGDEEVQKGGFVSNISENLGEVVDDVKDKLKGNE